MRAFIDLEGKVFGRLTVINRAENDKYGNAKFLCQCICKKEVEVHGSHLRSGRTKSCKCLMREMAAKQAVLRNTTHGHNRRGKRSPSHSSWASMLTRTRNFNNTDYKRYGGRNITVCDRWNPRTGGSFHNFLADLGGERLPGTTLGRIDGDLGYCPENCDWQTRSVQMTEMWSRRKLKNPCHGGLNQRARNQFNELPMAA